MTISLLSFGAGGENYYKCVERMKIQGKLSGLFSTINVYTDKELKETEFYKEHGHFIENNPKGYGYWLWKPYFILKTLESMTDEYLIYMDSGCEINYNHINKLDYINNYKKIAINNPIIPHLFREGFPDKQMFADVKYTKMDLFNYLSMEDNPLILSTQVEAGLLFIRKCKETIDFVKEWLEIAIRENYRFLNDTPSTLKNHENFIGHRHDQSIFSALFKKKMYHENFLKCNPTDLLWYGRNRFGSTRFRY